MKKSPQLSIFPAVLAAGFLSFSLFTAPLQAGDVDLKNPGFEDPYLVVGSNPTQKAQTTGSMAQGWEDNSSWADVTVAYSADTESPQAGGSAQKVEVSRITTGAVQLKQKVQFQANHQYVFHVWMKAAQTGTVAQLLLRKEDTPWTTYASETAKLSGDWQEFTVSGTVTEDTTGFLMIVLNQPATVWIDEAKLEDLTN